MSSTFWVALIHNPFLIFTLLAGLFASVAGGIIGSYVVVKRIAFISGSIAHSVLSGMGICLWLNRTYGLTWLSPLYGAIAAAVLSALAIGWVHLSFRQREDSVIAAIWAIGMAIGILFVAQTPGYNVDITTFLLGNILWVSPADLITIVILDVVVIVSVALLHSRFLALCFDEDQANLQGVPVRRLYLFLLVLVALTVVLLVQVVGIVLVMTMLTIPPAVASLAAKRLTAMMGIAIILGMIFCTVGTWVSYDLDWPVGASIALIAGLAYLIALPLKRAL